MEKKLFDIQMFADDDGGDAAETTENTNIENEPGAEPKAEPKYTDEDVNRLLDRKFAEWQKKQEKKTSEAERLGRMTAEEKANERMKALEDRIRDYELRESRADMTKQARAMLQDKGIHADDALLANLIAEDAESTKSSVESFVTLFQNAVEKAVKERVKSDTPKAGGATGITKEQILNISNRAERQRLMAEHRDLF